MSLVKAINNISDVQQLLSYTNGKTKHQVLDPLSCMIRLGLLKYKQTGTKISICNNSIIFQPPSIFQGSLRWKNGDTRSDIHNLLKTIEKAINWYNIEDEKIAYIFSKSKEGLDKLLECYNDNSNITSHTLTYYSKIIADAIKNREDHVDVKVDDGDIYHESLSGLWNNHKIEIIYNIFLEMEKAKDEELESYINAIEAILYYKDYRVKHIVIEFSSSL